MRLISVIAKGALGLVTGLALLGVVSMLTEMRENREYYRDSILTVEDFNVMPVEADCALGYSAYEVHITVRNDSRFGTEETAVWRGYDGKSYDDIQTDDPGRYSSLKYAGAAMIPAGRQTVLKDRIYVRDGVKQVKVSYSAGYKDDTHEQTLEIP